MQKLTFSLFIFLILIFTSIGQAYTADLTRNWLTYKGAWFDIKYPRNFKAHPSMKSLSATKGYDSVFFTSPDDTVEFYVFSPQWNGEPKDIMIKPEEEEYIVQKKEDKDGVEIRSVTIKSKDKKYFRSYVDTENTNLNTRVVFGIKYCSQEAYKKYKKAYLIFKQSLLQYAD